MPDEDLDRIAVRDECASGARAFALKGRGMRAILYIVPVTLLLVAQAAAQQSPRPKFDQSANSKILPVKPPKTGNSCAAYGAGFVRLADTGTCVKVGGSIGIGVGANVGHR